MKLSLLVERMVEHMVEASATAEKAREMGLTYAGRGWWKDQTGKTVARTLDGNLVRVEDEPETGAEQPTGAAASNTEPANPEGGEDTEPEAEPQEPPSSMSGILSRMLMASDDNIMAVQKQLAKKFRAAQTPEERQKYQNLLNQAAEHEKNQKAKLQGSIDAVAQKRAERLADRKAKYAKMYPSPQI